MSVHNINQFSSSPRLSAAWTCRSGLRNRILYAQLSSCLKSLYNMSKPFPYKVSRGKSAAVDGNFGLEERSAGFRCDAGKDR